MKMTAKATADSVRLEMISEMDIQKLSQISEQEKLRFFTQLDNLISLHRRKYTKIVNIKKSMIEKILSKNEEAVSKIQFSGFADAWGQRRAGDITNAILLFVVFIRFAYGTSFSSRYR